MTAASPPIGPPGEPAPAACRLAPGIDTLMLVIALVAACAATARASLGLGLLLSALSAAALVRTVRRVAGDSVAGRRLSPSAKMARFFTSAADTLIALMGRPLAVLMIIVEINILMAAVRAVIPVATRIIRHPGG